MFHNAGHPLHMVLQWMRPSPGERMLLLSVYNPPPLVQLTRQAINDDDRFTSTRFNTTHIHRSFIPSATKSWNDITYSTVGYLKLQYESELKGFPGGQKYLYSLFYFELL